MIGFFSALLDCSFFAEYEPGSTHRELAQMHQVVVRRTAIAFGSVLAHGRDHYAVAQGNFAQRHGREQQRWHLIVHKY